MELNDKIAVITGAGSGIGRALALKFAQDGARFVVCTDLNADNAAATAAMIAAPPDSAGEAPRASGVALDAGSGHGASAWWY